LPLKGECLSTTTEYNDINQGLFKKRKELKIKVDKICKTLPKSIVDQAKTTLSSFDAYKLSSDKKVLNKIFELIEARREIQNIDEKIIESNYGLVLNYVRKFTSTNNKEDSRDFEGAAVLGLMRAIDSYDPSRGSKFSTWAYKPIQRECLKAVRDADFKQMNPGDFEKRPDILKAVKSLMKNENDPMPPLIDIARESGASLETVKRVINAPTLESLAKPMNDDGKSYLSDVIPDTDPSVEDTILAYQELSDLENFGLSALDEREFFVICRRFGLDAEPAQRLSAIGNLLGLSREAVRQVEAKALSKLNHPVTRRKLMRHGRA